jgi:urease accessory protein
MSDDVPLLVLLHLSDSLFPLGAFAHSDGLETATVAGLVRTASDLGDWMAAIRDESLAYGDGPALRVAWHGFTARRFDEIARVDDEVHALRPCLPARQASRAMGTRLLRTWQQLRPTADLHRLLTGGALPAGATLPVAFGVVSAASGVPLEPALEAFFYTRLAATVSAAMRLMPIGQHEAHTLLADALDGVPAAVETAMCCEFPGAFVPALDIAAMRHSHVHSRLFRS